MPVVYLSPDPINSTQLIPGGVVPAAGGKLFHYLAGSSTKTDVYVDNTGTTKWANPIILDSGGNLGGSNEVWIPAGVTVKFVLAPFNDTDPPIAPYKTWDNLSGINDATSILTEWIPGPAPTFVSATSFTLIGDQTATFTPGRRVKTTNTAGTRYGTISTSVFGAVTTVTITNDSGTLDSGLSAVWYALINPKNTSLPLIVSVLNFGAIGDGVTDDTAAIVAASVAAVASGGWVLFPRGIYLQSSVIALTSAHNNLKWMGCGDNGAVLKKHFNGTGITVTGCNGFEMHNMHYYGDQANFTGKGIVFSGTCNYPRFPGTVLEGFQSTFLEFGADSGYDFSALGGKAYLDRTNAQSALTTVAMAANDTVANHRHFEDFGNDGHFDFSGALATIVNGSRFNALVTSANTSVLAVTGCSWAATGAITVNSVNTTIVGNRLANSITLAAGSSGAFIGNHPTSGTFTNNTAAGSWTVLHRVGAATTTIIGQHLLDNQDSTPQSIQIARTTFPGDADTTLTAGFANRCFYQAPITAPRTVTMSTTNAKDGNTNIVTRQAAATGASTVTVGSKALAVSQWVMHTFDGSAWQLTAFGSL